MERKRLIQFNEKGIAWFTGHCLEVMRKLPADCVQMAVTSPPYFGLRAYGTSPQIWGGKADCKHQWEKGRRIAVGNAPSKKTTLTGGRGVKSQTQPTETFTGFTCQKCNAWQGELGAEPTPQLYVAHLTEIFTELRRVLKPDGVLFLNLGDTYASSNGGSKRGKSSQFNTRKKILKGQSSCENQTRNVGLPIKNLIGIPWRVAFALQESGWILRSECIWEKRNAMPESATDRPNRNHEHVFMLVKQPKYYFNMDAVRVQSAPATLERDKYTRITQGKDGQYAVAHNHETPSNAGGRNLRTVWDIPTRPYRGSHFAVFPPALPSLCIRAASKPGDIVLDPFGGSGCTAYVAAKLNRRCISIELNPQGERLAKQRAGTVLNGFFGNYDINEE